MIQRSPPEDMMQGLNMDISHVLLEMLGIVGNIKAVTLLEFPAASRMQSRLSSPVAAAPVIDRARRLCIDHRVPFWDTVLLSLPHEPDSLMQEILSGAQFHQSMAVATRTEVQTSALKGDRLAEWAAAVPHGRILALSSYVELDDGRVAHLPMLDFRIEPTPENLTLVVEMMETLGLAGWVFESGRSYHFYGTDLLRSLPALQTFLGKSLLFMPVIDPRWIAHQLIEGACALRISRGGRFQINPRLVRCVG